MALLQVHCLYNLELNEMGMLRKDFKAGGNKLFKRLPGIHIARLEKNP